MNKWFKKLPETCLYYFAGSDSTMFMASIQDKTGYFEGDLAMENTINWETDIRQALKRARVENKPVMLNFLPGVNWMPGNGDCYVYE